jgi:tetratricopeptide (TPR) repeat protein
VFPQQKYKLVVLFWLMTASFVYANNPTTLPPLPKLKLGNFSPLVNRQLQEAYSAAQKRPTDPVANGKLGMLLDTYEQYDVAAICYRRAHLLRPRSFRWIYYLGYVEFKQGQYDQAEKTLRAAIPLSPTYLPAKLKLAECMLRLNYFKGSGKLYKEIVEQSPENAEAYYGLGRTQAAAGDANAAVLSLKKACALFPEYGIAQYALALAYRKLGNQKEAAKHFNLYKANTATIPPSGDPLRAEVKKLNQGAVAVMQRGLALAAAGDISGAIIAQSKALAIDPELVQAHINLMELYGRIGDYSKALQEYQAAVKINPNRADCYYNYGVLEFKQRNYQEALQGFRHALQINPHYAEAHNNLAYVLAAQGHLNEALEEFQKAVADRPDYRLARFHIGQIYVSQGRYSEAIQEFQKILAPEDARTPSFLYALGATYAHVGDRPNALLYMHKARDEAAARGQAQLLATIKHDLASLEQ